MSRTGGTIANCRSGTTPSRQRRTSYRKIPGVLNNAEPNDDFGSALTVGDFDNDGFADLAIGVVGESVGSNAAAGAVNVLYGTAAGLTGSGSQYFTQNSPGVWSTAEAYDQFGDALGAAAGA